MGLTFSVLDRPVLTAVLGFPVYFLARLAVRKPYDPLPLIGHLHVFALKDRRARMEWHVSRMRDTGERTYCCIVPGVGRVWATSDPVVMKHLFTNKSAHFGKGAKFVEGTKDILGRLAEQALGRETDGVLGTGILNARGEAWRVQRQASQVLHSEAYLRRLAEDVVPRNTVRAFERLDASAATGETIDFEQVVHDLTLAVIGEMAFDADPEEIVRVFGTSFDSIIEGIPRRVLRPFLTKWEPHTAKGRAFRSSIGKLQEYTLGLVRKVKAEMDQEALGGEVNDRDDVKGSLIRSLLRVGLTEQEAADSCRNFLIAGRDTTADAITWTTYAVIQNPQYLPHLQEEISQLPSGTPQLEWPDKLPLLNAFVAESLRLYPPAPQVLTESHATEPIVVPSQPNVVIKPGDVIFYSVHTMSRLPAIWGPDAETFRAERFLPDSASAAPRLSAWENPIFHAGPRAYPGKQMAKIEILIAMKHMLERYEFQETWGGGERHLQEGFTAPMLGGLPVRVKRRAT